MPTVRLTAEQEAALLANGAVVTNRVNPDAFAIPAATILPPAQGCDEDEFRAWIKTVAERHGFTEHYHTFNSRRSPEGWPDDVFGRDWGILRVVIIEAKVAPRKPTAAQLRWIKILDEGERQVARVFYPDQRAEIEELFRRP